jgi:hypothetical protein
MANFYVIAMAIVCHGHCRNLPWYFNGKNLPWQNEKNRDCSKNITIAPLTYHRISFRMFCDAFKK